MVFILEPATLGHLDLPGCVFSADDTDVMPALQKPKDAPRIQKAAADARDHGVAFGKKARAECRAKGQM